MKHLFKGKDTPAEEKKEARALRSGAIGIKDYLTGERMEGHKGSAKTAKAIKSGKMTPAQYAAKESKEKRK